MPNAPLKACSAPGCRNRVVRGRCAEHAREKMRLADERRGSRHERGYTDEWAVYARNYRRDHPLCADPYRVHGELGVFVEVVDHIVPPWAGGDFWDPSNHQPLCTACNLRKAADDRRIYRETHRVI